MEEHLHGIFMDCLQPLGCASLVSFHWSLITHDRTLVNCYWDRQDGLHCHRYVTDNLCDSLIWSHVCPVCTFCWWHRWDKSNSAHSAATTHNCRHTSYYNSKNHIFMGFPVCMVRNLSLCYICCVLTVGKANEEGWHCWEIWHALWC